MKDEAHKNILAAFPGKRVLIVGDLMLDEYIWGEVRRISPEAPVPVVEIQRRTYEPGGAANTAANVVGLSGVVLLGGVVGNDPQADQLRAALRKCGIDPAGLIVDSQRSTTTKTRVVAHSQQVVRVDHEHRVALAAALEETLLRWIEQHLNGVDACILSDYSKGVVSTHLAERFLRLARQTGKPVIVDPKGSHYGKYRGASVVKPNLHEAGRFFHREITDDAGLLEVGQQLVGVLDGAAVLITRGAQGMSLFRSGSEPLHIPSRARNVFDVTGAGDTVVGTLALALAAGATLDDAAHIANRAAGIVVGKVGTATVTLDELLSEEN